MSWLRVRAGRTRGGRLGLWFESSKRDEPDVCDVAAVPTPRDVARAHRLMSAWNAAHSAGLSTEALEAGVVEKALEALIRCEEQLAAYEERGWLGDAWRTRIGLREDLAAARAVLALAGKAEPRS